MAPNLINYMWFGDTHGPKPYKFIGLVTYMAPNLINSMVGDINGPKPYKLKWFGDIHGPKLYKFQMVWWHPWPQTSYIHRFGDIHDPKPYKFNGW